MPTPDFVLALRAHVGRAELWLPGATAVVRREGAAGAEVLMLRAADTGEWMPPGGLSEPGEDPGVTARRETEEETGVRVGVDRLASVTACPPRVLPNGDRVVLLDHTFACTWVSGQARVADDESVEVGWFGVDDLPPMQGRFRDRIDAGLSEEVATRFRA